MAAGALLSRFRIDALLEFFRVVVLELPLLLLIPPAGTTELLFTILPAGEEIDLSNRPFPASSACLTIILTKILMLLLLLLLLLLLVLVGRVHNAVDYGIDCRIRVHGRMVVQGVIVVVSGSCLLLLLLVLLLYKLLLLNFKVRLL